MSTYPVQLNMPPTVEGAWSHAWRILTRHFWPLMGMLGIWIASQAPAFVLGAAAAPLQERAPLAWLLLQLMSSG